MTDYRPIITPGGFVDMHMSRKLALKALAENWIKWENAKADYAALRASYTDEEMTNLELGLALDRAGSDDRIKKAIKDTAYYRAETMAYAAIVEALRQ